MKVNEEEFEKILKTTQEELKEYCENKLKESGYHDIKNEDGFLYAKGDMPILLVAHLDRHFNLKDRVITIDKSNVDKHNRAKWTSPEGIAGDDRCGVYMVLELMKEYKPYVLFVEEEEKGCIGTKKFIETSYIDDIKELNYIIQPDRGQTHNNPQGKHNKHGRDVIFYDIENNDFIDKVCNLTSYKIGQGMGTDATHIMNATNICCFVISCGYYDEHHLNEYIILEEMQESYDAIKKVIDNMQEKYCKKAINIL